MTANVAPPSNQLNRTAILIVLALGTFILGLSEFSMMPMLPLISETFGSTPSQSGYAISAYALGVVVGAPILMLTTANMRKRKALLIFLSLMCISNSLSAFATSLEQLVLFRFLSGLPHGAYFGAAILLASEIAPAGKRASFMSKVFMGLTIATIVGVPVVTLVGQNLSWRYCLAGAGVLAFIAFIFVYKVVPNIENTKPSNLLNEFGVLKNKLVWSILGIVIIGFGGVFCIYTYVADTILEVTETAPYTISIAMVMFGIGSTLGNYVLGKAADKSAIKTTGLVLVCTIVFAFAYVTASHNIWLLYGVIFFIGCSLGLATLVQTLLMDVSPNGHAMIGALVQCAFNVANAIGPWVGGIAIAQGAAPNQTGYVAAALFVGGFIMWLLSYLQMSNKSFVAKEA
ncbi:MULTISPECIES: MFS transporter [Pseudoalteromonas]|jgi:DHA1 family inner membrane transport protein|uniref:MFS transporter n=1 Tax=Pseudoalteromonas TaxID=53246 RepID=UPI0015CE7C5C|nr:MULTISPECIES: MFS transporter [Pseudoalteromonas]MBB1371495.1 MFS transporter [Pseudoalteromonas sp. SR45-4]MBE0420491.1 MFS transporter [Pseudoalteromonas nigrifaciens]NYR13434.1 MFS transporter [Pseudoalteromonas sp. MIP2626]